MHFGLGIILLFPNSPYSFIFLSLLPMQLQSNHKADKQREREWRIVLNMLTTHLYVSSILSTVFWSDY